MDHSSHTDMASNASASAADAAMEEKMMHAAMMTPFFHFTPGDHLFFKEWVPRSDGAVAGACILLFVLAVLERLLCAVRSTFEKYWAGQTRATAASSTSSMDGEKHAVEEGDAHRIPPAAPSLGRLLAGRALPPFIPRHDIPRGLFQFLQSFLGYALMLAVMTFRTDFFICIVAGHTLGEVAFGRFGGHGAHTH